MRIFGKDWSTPEQEEEPLRPAKYQTFRPREGFKDVSDRLDTLVHVGGNTFGNKRKPLLEENDG